MNKTYLLIGGALLFVVLGVGGFLVVSQMNKQTTPGSVLMDEKKVVVPTQAAETSTSEGSEAAEVKSKDEIKTITLTEIQKHATSSDCWFAVSGNVYDVTKYIAAGKHPGDEAILEGCGKDATVLFTTRPMGSGTNHSEKATNYLQTFKIGVLAK